MVYSLVYLHRCQNLYVLLVSSLKSPIVGDYVLQFADDFTYTDPVSDVYIYNALCD